MNFLCKDHYNRNKNFPALLTFLQYSLLCLFNALNFWNVQHTIVLRASSQNSQAAAGSAKLQQLQPCFVTTHSTIAQLLLSSYCNFLAQKYGCSTRSFAETASAWEVLNNKVITVLITVAPEDYWPYAYDVTELKVHPPIEARAYNCNLQKKIQTAYLCTGRIHT